MKRLVHGPQVVAVDVRVQLRGGQVRVTEHFLDGAKVGATLEQVRRERVPQGVRRHPLCEPREPGGPLDDRDRKSTRLNSSHSSISYAVFCLKKKKNHKITLQNNAKYS